MGDQQIVYEVPVNDEISHNGQGPLVTHSNETTDCPQIPCEVPTCLNCMNCYYQQPPRQQMCLPEVSYIRPTAPIETDTIYKRSYPGNVEFSRATPIRLKDSIKPFEGQMDTHTIQKLSYPEHCHISRVQSIRPPSNGIRFDGPYQDLTSQKNDYVPKCYSKRSPIKTADGIEKSCAPLEKCTVNKLSYMPYNICNNPPPKPILQPANYIRPDGPSEHCTVQKLSYLPVPLPPKEDMPWAKYIRVEPPRNDPLTTTHQMSYIPNHNPQKTPAIAPVSAIKIFGSEMADKNTVYKLSYLKSGGQKPDPIMPRPGISFPTGGMEKATVYKLSYQPQCSNERTKPIRPKENHCKSNAPIQKITTQKHDYVAKPCGRRGLIIPLTSISTPNCPMEKCTVNKFSYMPVCNPIKSYPILPRHGITKVDAPLAKSTTYKLSYMPVPIQPKEHLPWAGRSSCIRPTAPIEKCTIQKLSYGAPGVFLRKGSCGCCCASKPSVTYPKAAVC